MTVVAPKGFRAAGVRAGIKTSGDRDLALVVNDGPAFAAAGVFTTNRVKASPVLWSQQVVRGGRVRAVVLNSGGANACTGPPGFQDTHRTAERVAEVLGESAAEVAVCFTPMPLNISMLMLLCCIAFGLSMDYEVFVLSRLKEMHDAGADNHAAVTQGLARSGRLVTTAAALLAVSFFAFVSSEVSFIQFFGLGTGLAILIDATLIRGILVPATMRLLGDAAWYAPRRLSRLHARLALSEA